MEESIENVVLDGPKLEIYRDALEPIMTNILPRAWERAPIKAVAARFEGQKIMKRPEIRARNSDNKENMAQFELESEGKGARKRVRLGVEENMTEPQWVKRKGEEFVAGKEVLEEKNVQGEGQQYIPRKRTNMDCVITPRKERGRHAMLSVELQVKKEKSPRRRKSMRKSMCSSAAGVMREFGLGASLEEVPDKSLNSLDTSTMEDSTAVVPATDAPPGQDVQVNESLTSEISADAKHVQAISNIAKPEVDQMDNTKSSLHHDDLNLHIANDCIFDSVTSLSKVAIESWATTEPEKAQYRASESESTPMPTAQEAPMLDDPHLSPQSPSRQIMEDYVTSLTPARKVSSSPTKKHIKITPTTSQRTRRSIRTPRATSVRFGGGNATLEKAAEAKDDRTTRLAKTERPSTPVENSPLPDLETPTGADATVVQAASALSNAMSANLSDLQHPQSAGSLEVNNREATPTQKDGMASHLATSPRTPTSVTVYESPVRVSSEAPKNTIQETKPGVLEDDEVSDDLFELSSTGGFSPIATDDFTLSLSKSYSQKAVRAQETVGTPDDTVPYIENDFLVENLPGTSTPDPTISALVDTISENAPVVTYNHDDTDMLRSFLSRVKANKAAKASTSSPKKIKRPLSHSPLQVPLGEPKSNNIPPTIDEEFDIGPPATSGSPFKRQKRCNPLPKVDEVRRSARTRLPVFQSVAAAPSFIPVRTLGQDGESTVALRNSEEKERAVLTRVNTRKNKGGALSAPALLKKKLAEKDDPVLRQRLLKEVFDDKSQREAKTQVKNVTWAAEIAVYQEFDKNRSMKDKPKAGTKERNVQLPAEKEVKESEEALDKKSSLRVKSKLALGMAANGTPAPKRRTRGGAA